MNNKYFWHALAVTAFATLISWSNLFDGVGNRGGGSSWSSGSGSGYGGYSGGHK